MKYYLERTVEIREGKLVDAKDLNEAIKICKDLNICFDVTESREIVQAAAECPVKSLMNGEIQ